MATRSNIRVILKEEDRNRNMKFNPEMLEIKNTWGDEQCDGAWEAVNPEGKEALIIYHHWDGYPEGVGKTLVEKYNDYDSALNLILGGDISSINGKYSPYAVRKGEEWDAIKPAVVDKDYPQQEEYDYMFDDGKWYVRGGYDEDLEDWVLLETVLKNK
jgi:hypothetical protein